MELSENEEKIIQDLKLTQRQVLLIVRQWYNREYPDILQNEEGDDLEEICDFALTNGYIL